MTVQFQAAMFVAAAPSRGSGGPPKRAKARQRSSGGARAPHDPALFLGQPLPHMGTCKHYHHSHRCLLTVCCYALPLTALHAAFAAHEVTLLLQKSVVSSRACPCSFVQCMSLHTICRQSTHMILALCTTVTYYTHTIDTCHTGIVMTIT